MSSQTSLDFRANAASAIEDDSLRKAMRQATDTFGTRRTTALESVDFAALREKASAIKMEVLDNLPEYIARFTTQATQAGATVHRAEDAASANTIIADILKNNNVRMVAKGKSMISEETHLNAHLEQEGFEVVETDLGEYIIQLEGETPSHIIVPAIHKNRRQVGRLFADRLGVDYSEDPQVLTKIARKVLREKFLTADAGISGANFAIADSGSLVLFTNEGNGRMVTSVPPLHIAILSIEKILPSLADLPTFMRLLPRSATGQMITSYVSILTGTRKTGDATGARELHIVLLDNGRSTILKGDCREMLKCIRCGACMNVYPVYRTVGGHAYGWTYPGPMGIVLTTLLTGMARSHPLVDASTLCGACNDACPVKVPLQEMILKQRIRRVSEGFSPTTVSMGMRLFGAAVKSPLLFSAGETGRQVLVGAAQCGWGKRRRKASASGEAPLQQEDAMRIDDSIIALFLENAAKSAAVTHRAEGPEELRTALSGIVAQDTDVFCPRVTELEKTVAADLSRLVSEYTSAQITVEEVSAAIAETGSIVCASSGGKAVQASLLPSQYVAIVPHAKIFATLDDFFAGFAATLPTNLTIITGPSRTADIELNLVIGVHGPERLDIIVV